MSKARPLIDSRVKRLGDEILDYVREWLDRGCHGKRRLALPS